MKYKYIFLVIITISIAAFIYAESPSDYSFKEIATSYHELIESDNDDFNTMMDVVTHKRCMNCHPSGERPRQGEDSHIHHFNVQRGKEGRGIGSLKCISCHRNSNNDAAGIPGAPNWHLSPRSMSWEGLSRTEIAASFLNREQNGDKSLEDIVKHMTEDELVLWAFDPGINNEGIPREKPPVTKEDYIEAVKNWAKTGAVIPKN